MAWNTQTTKTEETQLHGGGAEKIDVAGVQAIAVPGTSEALVAAETMVRSMWVMAKRAGAANAGAVYLKQGTAPADLRTDHAIALDPGDYWEKPVPLGTKYDLANLYLDADVATDGVVFGYIPV